MLTKRIVACLDVLDGKVVKGTQFKNHEVMGDILDLALRYRDSGIDELVFYDISASSDRRRISSKWVNEVARILNIPFCVAGGIRTEQDAAELLYFGADKISINTPALEDPDLISRLSERFGQQCIVVGVDSQRVKPIVSEQPSSRPRYQVYSYTGRETTSTQTGRDTLEWIQEAQARGAGEIVLNCMDQDGTGSGYDLEQLSAARKLLTIPLVASGGARTAEDFEKVFKVANVDAALAARVFHNQTLRPDLLKQELKIRGVEVRQ